jgi:hypothetical protein
MKFFAIPAPEFRVPAIIKQLESAVEALTMTIVDANQELTTLRLQETVTQDRKVSLRDLIDTSTAQRNALANLVGGI